MVVAALRRIIKSRKERKDYAVDMLTKVKMLFEQARSRVVSLRAVDVSELREKIDELTDGVEAKVQELQTIPGLVAETSMLREEAGKL